MSYFRGGSAERQKQTEDKEMKLKARVKRGEWDTDGKIKTEQNSRD